MERTLTHPNTDLGERLDVPKKRYIMGGTRTVIIQEDDILYIAFRGSAGLTDWATNLDSLLVDLPGQEEGAKVHRGFNKRAESIMKEIVLWGPLLTPENLPNTIVVTGHSLGAALSEIVYIRLKNYIQSKTKSKIINISFAGPMVGNSDLRRQLQKDKAKNMYHFVLAEDIIPAMAFINHLFQRLPELKNGQSKKVWYEEILLPGLLKKYQVPVVPGEDSDLFVPPVYEQPVYDNDTSMEAYAPIGNYLYIKDGQLYELPFDMDPQYVAQALTNILEVMRQMAPVQALLTLQEKLSHPLVRKLRKEHDMPNYDVKLAELTI